jgi:hypothetical protein
VAGRPRRRIRAGLLRRPRGKGYLFRPRMTGEGWCSALMIQRNPARRGHGCHGLPERGYPVRAENSASSENRSPRMRVRRHSTGRPAAKPSRAVQTVHRLSRR